MNLKILAVVFALLLVFLTRNSCEAKFMQVQVKLVPLTRLTTNLESRLKDKTISTKDRAMLEFQIGRLHSMAYAQKSEDAKVKKEPDVITPTGDKSSTSKNTHAKNEVLEPFFGYMHTDYRQFALVNAPDATAETNAKEHLKQAIDHFRKAEKLDPNFGPTQLGLAWCLDQSGDGAKAIPLYREVLSKTFEDEKNRQGFRGTSVYEETATYLVKLLNPKKDATEIAEMERKKSQVVKSHRAVTPIVVALKPRLQQQDMMKRTTVRFDLDGNGERVNNSWPSAEAGWLVYDASGKGAISSGLELFGCSTFWIFWRDGYEALAALDDDGDGVIAGAERHGLAIWQDLNYNGVSDSGEVKSLEAQGIESLSCQAKPGANGFLHNPAGVRFSSGEVGETVDWIVK